MKKKSILLLLFISCFFSCSNCGYTINSDNSNYEIIQEDSLEEVQNIEESKIDSIFETNKIKILKINDKYAIFDKENNSMIFEPIIDEISSFNEYEYKIKVGKLLGYIDIENKNSFLTNYDDIILFGNYIKTKKQNKYGLIDKKANIILKPIYERIGIFYSDNEEFISGKYEGRYKLYKNTGNLIPEEELYVISGDNYYLLAQNLKPELKKYRYNKSTVYQKVNSKEDNKVYEIQEIKIPENIKTAVIKKDVMTENTNNDNENSNSELFTINNKQFLLINKNDKYGISTLKGKELIPAKYDEILPLKLCEHYKQPVFLTIRNGIYSAYDSKGKLSAEQVYDKINIYKYGQLYTYTREDGIWVLKCNGKLIGKLFAENQSYKFEKTKFHIFGIHKINELFISILENTK